MILMTSRLAMAMALLAAALVPQQCIAQYAYHSKSPFGPWEPIIIPTPPGVHLPPGAVWYGPHCKATAAAAPLDCGGNNPSPYVVDAEAGNMTGFAPGTVIIATTWSGNYSYDREAVRVRSAIVVGIAKNWSMPVELNPTSLFHLPHQNNWANFTNVYVQATHWLPCSLSNPCVL